jgi:hypothetical protein
MGAMSSTPFVCNMNALSHEQRARHGELKMLLRSALVAVHELSNGYDFEFQQYPVIYTALTEIVPLEHACCPFFAISIRIQQTGALFWQLTGSEGVKQFIRMEFAEWFQSSCF